MQATTVVLVILLIFAYPVVELCFICIILFTSLAVKPAPPFTPVIALAVIFISPEVADGVNVVPVVFTERIGPDSNS